MSNINPHPDDFQGRDSDETQTDDVVRRSAEIPISALAAVFSDEAARLQARRPTAPRAEIDKEALVAALFKTGYVVVSRRAATSIAERTSPSEEQTKPNATDELLNRIKGIHLTALDSDAAHKGRKARLSDLQKRIDEALEV